MNHYLNMVEHSFKKMQHCFCIECLNRCKYLKWMQHSVFWKRCRSVASLFAKVHWVEYRVTHFWKIEGVVFLEKGNLWVLILDNDYGIPSRKCWCKYVKSLLHKGVNHLIEINVVIQRKALLWSRTLGCM